MVAPRVVSQMLSRPVPFGSYDCGPASTFAALYLASGGAFRIGQRSRRAAVIGLIRTRGGMTDGPDGTSIEEQCAAFRAFAPEFAALGLGAPHIQTVRGGSISGLHGKLVAGKSAIVSVGYGPIDAYLGHADSGTWGFTGSHASVVTLIRTESGIEVVTFVDPLDDGRFSTSGYMAHSGYTPRGPITLPWSVVADALAAYHGRGTATYGAFDAAGVVAPPDETDGSGSTGSDAPGETSSGYPGRGAWDFYNETRDFHFWPTLDSISVSDGRPDELATFSATVVDRDGSLIFRNEDVIAATFAGDYLFRGDLVVPGGSYRSAVGPRAYDLTGQDFTARLDDDVIDNGKRPKESARARIEWIMAQGTRGITYAHIDPPDVQVDKADLTGQTVREALDATIQDLRCHYYVDWDLDLHLFVNDATSADYALDDVAPDYIASFPFWGFTVQPDSTDFHDRTFVQGDKPAHSGWQTDYSWSGPAGVAHAERAISDSNIKSSAAAARAGQRDLDLAKSPVVTGELDCAEPGLIAGTTIHINAALWPEWAGSYILVNVSTSAIDAHDAAGLAALRVHATYRDRRRGAGGPSVPDQVNKLTRQRDPGPTAADVCDDGTIIVVVPDHAATAGYPFGWGSGAGMRVASAIDGNTDWYTGGCAVGPGLWSGVTTTEIWYTLAYALGDRVTGVEFTFAPVVGALGVARMAVVGIGYGVPTGLGQFSVYGNLDMIAGGRIIVPRDALVGAEYLVVAPAWRANPGAFFCAEDILDGAHGPIVGGEGNSGGAPAPGVTARALEFCSDGRAEWVGADGAADGSNTVYTLIDWAGTGTVEARVGAVILGAGDFTVDAGAGTVTLSVPPPAHAHVAFSYDVVVP